MEGPYCIYLGTPTCLCACVCVCAHNVSLDFTCLFQMYFFLLPLRVILVPQVEMVNLAPPGSMAPLALQAPQALVE